MCVTLQHCACCQPETTCPHVCVSQVPPLCCYTFPQFLGKISENSQAILPQSWGRLHILFITMDCVHFTFHQHGHKSLVAYQSLGNKEMWCVLGHPGVPRVLFWQVRAT